MIGLAVGTGFPNDGERLAPVTLAAEEPVAEFVVDGLFAEALGFEPGGDLRLASGVGRPLMEISGLAELTEMPSSTKPRQSLPSGGWTTWTMGRLNLVANSKSRVSWPGTAMMAPVP